MAIDASALDPVALLSTVTVDGQYVLPIRWATSSAPHVPVPVDLTEKM